MQSARPLRLKIVTVNAGDTLEGIATRYMSHHDMPVERFRVLNGLDRNARLKPGDQVKVVGRVSPRGEQREPHPHRPHVAVIGAGPAGLMAAEVLAAAIRVTVYDHMPSVGRKFLMAGRGGLNLTHSEPLEKFLARYGAGRSLAPCNRGVSTSGAPRLV